LALENIHPIAIDIFRKEGYSVEVIKGSSLDENELCEKIKDVSILCIRSKTQVTAKVLQNANKLMTIGAFCIGTNQIDLDACLEKGVTVFNAPYSNTRSVVELAIGQIIMLMRNIFPMSSDMHAGKWNKSAKDSYEIRGKKLGIVGYGNIGAQLSVLAEALGMEVYYYDVVEKLALGNAKKCATLADLLRLADIVTLHVDGRNQNKHLIGREQFDLMKEGVIFLNLSRGHVVDIEALAANMRSGKVRGAAVDVFPEEPKGNVDVFASPLVGLPNLILTPHIGGSTEEAQENIGAFVSNRMIQFINKGDTFGSVNFPNLQLPEQREVHRLIHIHENQSGILAKINHALAANDINILGQYLKTNEKLGYVITDIDKEYNRTIIDEMRKIPHTIKFRVLY
jgi:D-3-phosphoglycerate dehydrogenase